MDRTKNDDYKSAVVAFAVATALLLAAVGLPAQFASLLLPLAVVVLPPLLGFAVASGGFAAGGAAAALCFAAGAALDYKASALLAAASIPFALVFGYVVRKKIRFRYSVMATCGAALAGAALAVGVLWLLTGLKPVDYIVGQQNALMLTWDEEQVRLTYQFFRYSDLMSGGVTQAALDAASSADAIAFLSNTYYEILNMSLVSMIGGYALLMGLLGYLIPRGVLKRRKADVIAVPPFSEYALPDRFWLAFLASYLFAAIGGGFGWPGFDILQITVYALYALVLTVQGLAFLDYVYKKRNMSTGARVALHGLAVVISSFAALVGSMLLWVGLFENIMKLRKRMETKGGAVL